MHAINDLVANITGSPVPPSCAPHPVWRGSHVGPLAPPAERLRKQEAIRLYHDARRHEARTRQPGRQDGAIGRSGLKVLESLLFDFLHYGTGRCDPSAATIARRAGISVRSVHRGLTQLRAAGIVDWVRRCSLTVEGGRVRLRQKSNSYMVHRQQRWHGFQPDALPPRPSPSEWGARPMLPPPIAAAASAIHHRDGPRAVVRALEGDSSDALARALGSLGRAVAAQNS